jgi:hypothetical protein
MDTDEMTRILVEVTTGKPPAKPDTVEFAVMRKKLKREVDEIRAKGGTVLVPHEIPSV